MRILCDYLCIMGFLAKDGGRYSLTQDSAVFLDKRSPAYLGGAIEFLLSPMLTDGFKDLAAAVRKGGAVISEEGVVAPEHPNLGEVCTRDGPDDGDAFAVDGQTGGRKGGSKSEDS